MGWQDAPVVGGAPQAQRPTQAPAQAPRQIGGNRVLGGVPASEARAQQDQQIQMQQVDLQRQQAATNAAQEAERLRLANESASRQQAEFEGTGGTNTEGQDKTSNLLTRVLGGFRDIGAERANDPGVQTPGFVETVSRGTLGDGMITRGLAGQGRRIVSDAQRDMLDALLTLSTGAAYAPEQLDAATVSHFPQYNDTPREIEIKNRRLQRVIEAARVAAGPQWGEIEAAITPLMSGVVGGQTDNTAAPPAGSTPPRPVGGDGGPGGARAPTEQDRYANGIEFGMDTMGAQEASFDRNAYLSNELGIKPEQESLLTGFARANSGNANLTAEDVRRFYQSNDLPQPTEADLAQFVEDMRTTAPGTAWAGIDTTAPEEAYQNTLDAAISQRGDNPEGQGFSGIRGFGQGAQLNLGDELAGVLNAVGSDNPILAYQTERDVQRRMDERSSAENPWTYGGGQVLGGIVTGGAGMARNAPNTIASAARVGAMEGAVAGFGSGEGAGGSMGGAAIGAAGGAALGAGGQYIAPKVGNALSAILPKGRAQNAANALAARPGVEAARRMEVPVRGPDINAALRPKRAEILQGQNGQQIRDADTEDLAAMEAAIQRELGGSGAEPDRYGMGEGVQGAAKGARERTRHRAGLEYTAADRISRNVRATPTQALKAIDGQIEELSSRGLNANKEAIQFLRETREDLAIDGGMSIDALRAQRTDLASVLKTKNLDRTDLERRMGIVHDALASDLTGALRNTPEALARFRRADQMWRSQAEFGERIVRQIVGTDNAPVAAAEAARRVESFFQKDFARARRLMAELDEGQQAQISQHLADSLGRNRNGQFSMADFLRHTGRGKGALMDERSIRLAFGDRGMSAIQDLRSIATMKQAAQSQTNRSNTGGVVAAGQRNLRTLVFGGLGFGGGGPAGAVALPMAANALAALGQQRAVRLLLNPDVTRWLRQIPATSNPKAINTSFSRLRSVANRTPGMAADVQALERWIVNIANDNGTGVTGVAAQPQEQQGQ